MSLIQFDACTFCQNNQPLLSGFSWNLEQGQQWLISGLSGAGKTLFFQALTGKLQLTKGNFYYNGQMDQQAFKSLYAKTGFVFFQDKIMNSSQFYYQQRYNSQDADDTITVRDYLFNGRPGVVESAMNLLHIFNLEIQLDKEFIKLSNGENRKVLIAKALLNRPDFLILDNPYTGLDEASRKTLNELIDRLAQSGMNILLSSKQPTIPESVTHVLLLENQKIKYAGIKSHVPTVERSMGLNGLPFRFEAPSHINFAIAVQLNQVSIRYEEKILLDKVNLTIRYGEKWVIKGPNGAGKSLLASILYADHPQSYANDIILFDRPRGFGESIWDIKEKIGFISPEFHFYFDVDQTANQVVLSSLKENPYRPKPLSKKTEQLILEIFEYYHIVHLLHQPMYSLSTGIQRLILFIRILIKNPPFLLLDEPFQHFDPAMIEKSKLLLDEFCKERTMLFITHEDSEVPGCVGNWARMEMGRLLQASSPEVAIKL